MRPSKSKIFSKLLIALFFIIYYLPLISLAVFSFNSTKSVTRWKGFSLMWYQKLFTNTEIIRIILYTLVIALLSTIISVILGTLAAISLTKMKKNIRGLVLQANKFPITNPDIVTAIGLLLLFVSLGITRGYFTMLLAHISFCTPYVLITVYPKVKSLDPNIIEAAMDLGAKPIEAINKAVIPQIKSSIFAAAAISFTMSFDDFVISYFTGGTSNNISTYLYSVVKKIDPTFNALSVVIMFVIIQKIVIDKIREAIKAKNDEDLKKPIKSIVKNENLRVGDF